MFMALGVGAIQTPAVVQSMLLVELAKSANTRSMIGTVLTSDCDVESRVRSIGDRTNDMPLKKRIMYALQRFDRETKRKSLQT